MWLFLLLISFDRETASLLGCLNYRGRHCSNSLKIIFTYFFFSQCFPFIVFFHKTLKFLLTPLPLSVYFGTLISLAPSKNVSVSSTFSRIYGLKSYNFKSTEERNDFHFICVCINTLHIIYYKATHILVQQALTISKSFFLESITSNRYHTAKAPGHGHI